MKIFKSFPIILVVALIALLSSCKEEKIPVTISVERALINELQGQSDSILYNLEHSLNSSDTTRVLSYSTFNEKENLQKLFEIRKNKNILKDRMIDKIALGRLGPPPVPCERKNNHTCYILEKGQVLKFHEIEELKVKCDNCNMEKVEGGWLVFPNENNNTIYLNDNGLRLQATINVEWRK